MKAWCKVLLPRFAFYNLLFIAAACSLTVLLRATCIVRSCYLFPLVYPKLKPKRKLIFPSCGQCRLDQWNDWNGVHCFTARLSTHVLSTARKDTRRPCQIIHKLLRFWSLQDTGVSVSCSPWSLSAWLFLCFFQEPHCCRGPSWRHESLFFGIWASSNTKTGLPGTTWKLAPLPTEEPEIVMARDSSSLCVWKLF